MPTNLVAVVVILLFVAPGFVYYSSRSNAERKASELRGGLAASSTWTSDPLRQIMDSIIASIFFTGTAVGALFLIRWIVLLLVSEPDLPSPGAWIAQGWDYAADFWQWVAAAAAVELVIALSLAGH